MVFFELEKFRWLKSNIHSQITDCRAANSTLQREAALESPLDFQRCRVSLGAEVEKTPSRVCRYLASKACVVISPRFLPSATAFPFCNSYFGDIGRTWRRYASLCVLRDLREARGSGERIAHVKPLGVRPGRDSAVIKAPVYSCGGVVRRSVPWDELYWRTGRNIFDDCLQNPTYDHANLSTFNVAGLKLKFVSTFIRRLKGARLPVVNKRGAQHVN